MKKLITTLFFILFSPILWAFSPAELTQILQKPSNVQGAFTQQRFLKSLAKPMTTNGKFVLIPKKGLLWQMQKPFATTLRVRADGIKQWNGSAWVANASKLSGQSQQIQLFLDLLGGNTQGLEKQFAMQLDGNAQKWTLILTPHSLIMKQIFTKIVISGDTLVRQIEMQEKQGDKTIMQFNKVQTNQALDEFAKQSL